VTPLVPLGPGDREIADLRARLDELEATLTKRSTDVARVQAELDTFRIRYRQDVGQLHEELDDLEAAIAQAELGEIDRRLEAEGPARSASSSRTRLDSAPRFTSDAVRKLFRDVAKAIHPDLAHDNDARNRRHTLMIEANRAYALGDEEGLRSILLAWERSPEAVKGMDAEATRLRMTRRIAQIEEELATYDAELAELRDSPLGKLKAMVDEASSHGKDLVADMVRRLKRDIMAARNRLDAMQ
jgi:chromosome segregation ATPase